MRAEFERVGGGAVLNNSPYDLAAAALILEEAGAVVTDAYGRPLRDRPLLGSGPEFQMSVVATANAALHERDPRARSMQASRVLPGRLPEVVDVPQATDQPRRLADDPARSRTTSCWPGSRCPRSAG